jgi:hypothetical protein
MDERRIDPQAGQEEKQLLLERLGRLTGAFVVLAALALLSPGVRIARAGEAVAPVAAPATPSATAPAAATPVLPTVKVDDVENAKRPGVPAIEVQPGVVVLNTRGFNYGPPPTPLAPEALDQEKQGH